jgi:hypothetical protein
MEVFKFFTIYSNPCRSRKVFYPTPTLPLLKGGSKKITNDLGLLYVGRIGKKTTTAINYVLPYNAPRIYTRTLLVECVLRSLLL